MNKWIDYLMNRWINEEMNRWVDVKMNEVINEFKKIENGDKKQLSKNNALHHQTT